MWSTQVLEEVKSEAKVTEVLVLSDGTLRPIRSRNRGIDAMDELDTLAGGTLSDVTGNRVDVIDLSDVEIDEVDWDEKPSRVEERGAHAVGLGEVSRQLPPAVVPPSQQHEREEGVREREVVEARSVRFIQQEEDERIRQLAHLHAHE